MESAKKSNFSIGDGVVVVLSLFVLMAALFFIFDQSAFYRIFLSDKISRSSLAKISSVKKDVRRKLSSELTWIPASSSDSLGENAMVFTGKDSNANITFDDGSEFYLEPNSLVLVSQLGGENQIKIQRGTLLGKLGSKTHISIGDDSKSAKKIQGNRSEFSISYDGKQKTELTALKGQLRLSENGASSRIGESEALFIDGLEKRTQRLEIRPISPRPNEILYYDSEIKPLFQWSHNDLEVYRLRIWSDRLKSNLVLDQVIAGKSYTWATTPQDSKLFWQIESKKKGQVYLSNLSSFKLERARPPLAIFPISSPILRSSEYEERAIANQSSFGIPLSWRFQNSAKTALIEVSSDEKFTEKIHRSEVQSLSKKVFLRPGTYFWRVGTKTYSNSILWSRPVQFRLLGPGEVLPELELSAQTGDQSYRMKNGQALIDFYWKKNPDLSQYRLVMATESSFAPDSVFAQKEVQGESVQVKLKKKGKIYWKIVGRSVSSELQGGSLPASFEVSSRTKLRAPKIESDYLQYSLPQKKKLKVLNNGYNPRSSFPASIVKVVVGFIFPKIQAKETSGVYLNWDDVENALKYKIHIAKDSEFKEIIIDEDVLKSQYFPKFERTGTFFWRVAAIDEDGFLGDMSAIGKISVVEKKRRPSRPRMLSALKRTFKKERIISFRWKSPSQSYVYQISDALNFAKILKESQIWSNELKDHQFRV